MGGESGGIGDGKLCEAGEEVGRGRDELAEGLSAEDEAGRNGKAGLGETREVGAFAARFGELGGEGITEEEDVGHTEAPGSGRDESDARKRECKSERVKEFKSARAGAHRQECLCHKSAEMGRRRLVMGELAAAGEVEDGGGEGEANEHVDEIVIAQVDGGEPQADTGDSVQTEAPFFIPAIEEEHV